MKKRTWKQWKEDVKSMPLFQEDPAALILFFIAFIILCVLAVLSGGGTPAPWWM